MTTQAFDPERARPVVKGDSKSFCIAAASVIAKVIRRAWRAFPCLPAVGWHPSGRCLLLACSALGPPCLPARRLPACHVAAAAEGNVTLHWMLGMPHR